MERDKPAHIHTVLATLLVTGTCTGGGMLALPVATGLNGLIPSLFMMGLCYAAMTMTALLLLEATLWFGEGAHLATITEHILGVWGKRVSTVVYVFICYASLIAYTAGGGALISQALESYFDVSISKYAAGAFFVAFFYAVIFFGSDVTGRVNAVLVGAMVLAYLLLVAMGVPKVSLKYFDLIAWEGSFMALPLLLTSFSFQTMVPSLVPYLKRNVRALRIAVVAGTTLTFLIYALWQIIILGIIPVEGEKGLAAALYHGEPATLFLYHHVADAHFIAMTEYFAFFAIGTSFLGIAFGLFDFIADGLKISKEGVGKWVITLLIIVPTFFFASTVERIFLIAMNTSGGLGDAILNGMIPVLLIWVGRYKLGYPSGLPVGRLALTLMFVFYLFALLVEVADHAGLYDRTVKILKLINE